MSYIYWDRVKDTTTTTGTGQITVSGTAPTGFVTFSQVPGISVGNLLYYTIAHLGANEWEVGVGTWNGSDQFTRTLVIASSNSNNAVNFSAGTKDCFITAPAQQITRFVPRGLSLMLAANTYMV
jgi:hypothetical protein